MRFSIWIIRCESSRSLSTTQVDGLASIPMRRDVRGRALESTRFMEWEYSQDSTIFQELLYHAEGNIWEIVVIIIDPTEVGDPLKEEDI